MWSVECSQGNCDIHDVIQDIMGHNSGDLETIFTLTFPYSFNQIHHCHWTDQSVNTPHCSNPFNAEFLKWTSPTYHLE